MLSFVLKISYIFEAMELSFTLIIIAATALISWRAFQNREFKYKMMFYPYNVKHQREGYRYFTYMFVHADTMHLFFNMFVLYSFGNNMEMLLSIPYGRGLGWVHYGILYFAGGLFATVWPMIKNADNPNYMSLGASGAVSSVFFAFILWMPNAQLSLIFIPGVPIPAWLFGLLYLAYEYFMAKRGTSNIGHDAHFGGAIFGILYVLFINFEKGQQFISYIFN